MVSNDKRSEKRQIFLLRHGKPAFPDARSYIYGHTDYALCEEGIAQARRIGGALADVHMDRIVSSDLARARQTAEIVVAAQSANPPAVETDPELREIHMGEWDGMLREDVERDYGDIFAMRGQNFADVAAPGGESFRQLQERGLGALKRILSESAAMRHIMLVAHGGIFWGIVSGLFEIPLGDMLRFGLDYCALHLLEYNPTATGPWGNYKLIRYNWSPNLMQYMDFPIQ